MDENHIIHIFFIMQLPDSFQKRHTLDIAHCTANFNETYLGTAVFGYISQPFLYLVGNMRNYLYGLAQVIAPALLIDDCLVYLTCGYIVLPGQFYIQEPFIVTQVQVNFPAVL